MRPLDVAMAEPGIDTLRVPPHAVEAEQAVLGAIMLDPASVAKVSDWLGEEDFYRQDHRLIWRAITALEQRQQPTDTVSLMDWFDAQGLSDRLTGSSYLLELSNNTPSAANVVAYAEIVVEASRQRQLIDVGTRLTDAAYSRKNPSSLLVGDALRDLANIAPERRGGLESPRATLKRLNAQMLERYHNPDAHRLLGIATPWPDLDDVLRGLRPGNLIVLAGRPSMGKSIIGGQMALWPALAGKRVAWFSIEMTADECMARSIAAVGDVPHRFVELPDPADQDQDMHWQKILRANASILESGLLLDASPALTARQVNGRARRAHMQSPLDLIVVDHLHDLKFERGGRNDEMRHQIGDAAQEFKTLAKELDVPVVALAQLNRNVANRTNKVPTMTDLREAGELEQKADVILFVHREDYYDPKKNPGVVELIIGKGRNLPVGKPIILRNAYSRMRADSWDGDPPPDVRSAAANDMPDGMDARGRGR